MTLVNIGERLKQMRLDWGYSQAEMAARMNLDSPATISHYESGLRGITLETLTLYADVFDMTIQEIIAPVSFGEKVRGKEPLPFD